LPKYYPSLLNYCLFVSNNLSKIYLGQQCSAGYKDGNQEQRPWNLSKLLFFIVKNTPEEKRLSYVDNLSNNKEMWADDDELIDYKEKTQKSFQEVATHVTKNTLAGAAIGSVIPVVGTAIGAAVGAGTLYGVGAAAQQAKHKMAFISFAEHINKL
jgi:predicted GTPase